MLEASTPCPACGYDLKLEVPDAVVEHCPSCGFRFEEFRGTKLPYSHFDKNNLFVSIRRTTWVEAHMPWYDKHIPKPENWDPIKQMHRIGIRLADSFEEWAYNNPIISPENNERFLQIAEDAISRLDWKPQIIEALWDGDTQGWFLDISVSAMVEISTRKSQILFSLRGGGGDIRVFNGQVPPWPESQVARFIGNEISKLLSIPFYFPAPEQPDDGYAGWWERNEQKRCVSCGKYLRSVTQTHQLCSTCKRRQERANRNDK